METTEEVKVISVEDQMIMDNIKAFRESNGWTQEQLASHVNLHTTYVSALERGERKPGPKTMKTLCAAFGVTEREIRYGKQGDYNGQDRRVTDPILAALPDTPEVKMILTLLPSCSESGLREVLLTVLQLSKSAEAK